MDDSPQTAAAPVTAADSLLTPEGTPGPDHPSGPMPAVGTGDESDWCWPPYAPPPPADVPRFDMDGWAPSSTVRRPLVRVGRWTLLYRRG
ncbi:hypothetical protein SAMN05660199_01526 [Klenkia soli]|uniref:Uncharacterized protein n=1 Tax=Klenkia soli TaxID=1052260 RepID=A0A1H0HPH8_9ACTN|nr:hypothetical protein [Klenkia soli]SDO21048.1 hypothetical protein SAMN05660199_01526 [Klenkia soli]